MMNFRVLASCCCFALLLASTSPVSATVTVIGGGLEGWVYEPATNFGENAWGYGADFNSLTLSSVEGFLSQCDRIVSGDAITHNLEQVRRGGQGDFVYGHVYTLFEVDIDTPYNISGNFTNSAGYTSVGASISENGSMVILFNSNLENNADVPYTAHAGGTDGNMRSYLDGSSSGMLLAGRIYQFYVGAYTQASPDADNGATAFGSFTLQFGDPDVEIVPEPASIAVWSCLGLGAVGVTVMRRRTVAE